jgi:hypothetical protein
MLLARNHVKASTLFLHVIAFEVHVHVLVVEVHWPVATMLSRTVLLDLVPLLWPDCS